MPNGNVGHFQRAVDTVESFDQFVADYADLELSPPQLRRLFDKMKADKLYLSEFYQVAIDKRPTHGFPGMLVWHLSIKRIDKEPIMDWRDLQAIKCQLCGDEAEAIQLFPAKSRVVDTSNQYHLWVLMKGSSGKFPRLPIGWSTSMVLDEAATGKAKQRPLGVHHEQQPFEAEPSDVERARQLIDQTLSAIDDPAERDRVRKTLDSFLAPLDDRRAIE